MTQKAPEYRFDRLPFWRWFWLFSRRGKDPEKFGQEEETFWKRIHHGTNTQAPKVPDQLRRTLASWAKEVPQVIAWYRVKLFRGRSIWAASTIAQLVLFLGVTWAIWQQLGRSISPGEARIGLGEIGFAFVATFGFARLVFGVADVKAQVAGFWKASSALKSRLYALEDEWQQRLTVTLKSGASPEERTWSAAEILELDVALREQIRAARRDVAAEASSYFDTFRSPSDLASSVGATFSEVMAQAQGVVTARAAAAQQAQPAPAGPAAAATAEEFWAKQRAYATGTQVLALRKHLEQLQFEHGWRKKKLAAKPDQARPEDALRQQELEKEMDKVKLEIAQALDRQQRGAEAGTATAHLGRGLQALPAAAPSSPTT